MQRGKFGHWPDRTTKIEQFGTALRGPRDGIRLGPHGARRSGKNR